MAKQFVLTLSLVLTVGLGKAEEPVNLNSLPSDLTVPEMIGDQPAAGRRFRMRHPEYAGWQLTHAVYLPGDWKPGGKFPVLVEYPGNGGYQNGFGDKSTGRLEDCKLGYGISGGRGFIWVCLPFVDPKTKGHALNWWGDPDATTAYCRAAVAQVCDELGGDPGALVLTGFSRGALAAGYIGLRDEATAKLWRAVIAHSHFDGARGWDYPDSDAVSARRRLRRLGDRPLWVSHEQSVQEMEAYLKQAGAKATVRVLPYPNHTDAWVLKDIPLRAELRQWLARALKD